MEKKLIPDSPSPLEEEFEHEFTELIDQYKNDFLTHGWSAKELAKWCKEMVDKELRESEDERIRKKLYNTVMGTPNDSTWFDGTSKEAMLAWLEKQKEQKKDNPLEDFSKGYNAGYYHGRTDNEQKPVWSEEDEKMLQGIIERGQAQIQWCDTGLRPEQVTWLKSLRPPKDCSDCSKHLEGYISGRSDAENKLLEMYGILLMPDGELRMKPQWKPSEEQMTALKKVAYNLIGSGTETDIHLVQLYEQLKKL